MLGHHHPVNFHLKVLRHLRMTSPRLKVVIDASEDPFPFQTAEDMKSPTLRGEERAGAAEQDRREKKLSQQIDRLITLVENRNVAVAMRKNTSIPEVMRVVESLPGAEPGSKLWFFATRLFLSQEKREMFCTIKDPNLKVQWLNYELAEK
ncbi:hypothetical protein M0R45_020322 [Rubus argutus]|uniref:Uncharacterized protein n=1 Tax=Rubus argutus TaxID=59490 RepID=A0AAW1X9U0_RUBAR